MARIGATLFSGGRGVEALLTDAIDFRLAVEYDAAIAAVGAQLGGETIVSKVEDVDYSTWPELYYLHASPVCKEYSQAKSGGAEGESDLSSAAAVVRCLEATTPRVFTLENVGAYQHGQAYRRICQWLNHNGYMWHAEVLNSADFGVPQTRRRLILRAVRDALLPPLPAPEPWIGWYAAIEDLIPTLPESAFAPWQLERLASIPALSQTAMIWNMDQTMREPSIRQADQPVPTVDTGMFRRPSSIPQAFIIEGQTGADSSYVNVRAADSPQWTISASMERRPARAWLVGDQAASHGTGVQTAADTEPAFTLTTRLGGGTHPRAWLSAGRVVKMTPRALARFQSFPDTYVLPSKAALACTVIGNAVPPLLMSKIVRPLL